MLNGDFLSFSNVNYFSCEEGIFKQADRIEVCNGKITNVITDTSLNGDSLTFVDCRDKFMLPGLIDMHVHICWDGLSEAPITTMLNEGNYGAVLRGYANARDSLNMGVTTLRDVGCPDNVTIPLAKKIRDGLLFAADIIPCGSSIQITGGHCPEIGIIADTAEEMIRAVRYLKKEGAEWIKVMATGGAYGEEEVGPVHYSENDLKIIVNEAHRFNMKVCAHALSEKGIINCIEAGIDTIEHGSVISEEYLIKMKEKGIVWIPTLAVYQSLADSGKELPKKYVDKAKTVVQQHTVTFKNALKIGIKIALGTDVGGPKFSSHPAVLLEMLAMEKNGMSRSEVIRSATSVAASTLSNDQIGKIAEGKDADLLILNRNPLLDLNAFKEIDSVYKKGKRFR